MLMQIDKTLKATERAAALVAVGFILAIMLVVSADVVMRYFFNRPFAWAYDLIALYLMAGVFYFVLADAHRQHAHVSIDILQSKMRPRTRHFVDLLTALISVVLFSLIAYIGVERTWESFGNEEVLAGNIAWPVWLSSIIVPIGSILLVLRLTLQVVVHLAGLAGYSVLRAEGNGHVSHIEEIAQ